MHSREHCSTSVTVSLRPAVLVSVIRVPMMSCLLIPRGCGCTFLCMKVERCALYICPRTGSKRMLECWVAEEEHRGRACYPRHARQKWASRDMCVPQQAPYVDRASATDHQHASSPHHGNTLLSPTIAHYLHSATVLPLFWTCIIICNISRTAFLNCRSRTHVHGTYDGLQDNLWPILDARGPDPHEDGVWDSLGTRR